MTWFIFALTCAISEALKDLASKSALKKLDTLLTTWLFFSLTTIICSPILFFQELPELNLTYFLCLVVHGSIFGLSMYLYMQAISISKLELCIPLIMFTPAFVLLSAPWIIGEWPTSQGILGTSLIVVGAYLLKIENLKSGVLAPVLALFSERGSRLMLLVALIWSFTGLVDKIGIKNSSPIFWGLSLYAFISFYLTLIVLIKRKNILKSVRSNSKQLLGIGILNSIQMISYVLALQSGLVAYVIALKRTSVLFIMIISAFVYKDFKILHKLFAVGVMFLGVLLVLLS